MTTALLSPNESKEVQIIRAAPTPMDLMQIAVQGGAGVDAIAKLMDLQLRWEANEARRAFEISFAAFKAEAPKLEKNKSASFTAGGKQVAYDWCSLDYIADTLGPILAKHNLSYNWKQDAAEGVITVTCILRHKDGHSIENTLCGTADDTGAKNKLQAIGSTVSYLRRYTLLGTLGMAAADEDTDGMVMDNAQDFLLNIKAAADTVELKRAHTEAMQTAMKQKDYAAMKVFEEAKEKRKAELQEAQ